MLQFGRTALFTAAGRGHADTVKMLVDCGAAVDIRDEVTNCFITCMRIQNRHWYSQCQESYVLLIKSIIALPSVGECSDHWSSVLTLPLDGPILPPTSS